MADNRINIVASFNGAQAFAGISKLEKSFTHLKRIVFAVVGVKAMQSVANFGKEINMMADRTGLSVAKLSSLKNAFISAGSGAKGFQKTINQINEGLLGLSLGRGEYAAKLGMVGISPYTVSGALKTPDQILDDLADWANKQKGIMSKKDILYRLTSLFGIDEAKARTMLDGARAMRGRQAAANARMGILKGDESARLEKLKQRFDELFGTIENTIAKTVSNLEPYISPILESIQKFIKVAGEHPKVTSAIIGILGAFMGLAAVGGALSGLVAAISGLSVALPALTAALVAFGAAVAGFKLGEWVADIVDFFSDHDTEKENKVLEKYVGKGKGEKGIDFAGAIKRFGELDRKAQGGLKYKELSKDERIEWSALRKLTKSWDNNAEIVEKYGPIQSKKEEIFSKDGVIKNPVIKMDEPIIIENAESGYDLNDSEEKPKLPPISDGYFVIPEQAGVKNMNMGGVTVETKVQNTYYGDTAENTERAAEQMGDRIASQARGAVFGTMALDGIK